MNSWWKLIAVSRCSVVHGLDSASTKTKSTAKNLTPTLRLDLATAKMYVFWRTCVRHGKPGKVWNMVRVFLRPIFVYTILHGDSARGPRNARNEYDARRERATARNRYGGDLRSFHFLMSPPEIGFWAYFGGCLWSFRGESALRPSVFFWLSSRRV